MARHFQAPPKFFEPRMAEASDVWRRYDQAPVRLQAFCTFTQQGDRIRNVFNHVTQRYYVVAVELGQIRHHTRSNVKALLCANRHRGGIGIDAGNRPTEGTHSGDEVTIAATDVEQSSL